MQFFFSKKPQENVSKKMQEKTIIIEGLNIIFRKKTKNLNIRISIGSDEKVRVSVPLFCSFNQATAFVESQMPWIKKKMNQNKKKNGCPIFFDLNTVFNTYNHQLSIEIYHQPILDYRIEKNVLKIFLPSTMTIKDDIVQAFIKAAILQVLRLEAETYLPVRLKYLAGKHQLNYKAVKLKNNKSQWGSCSVRNIISLNIQCMLLPKYLIDYVILHELAHIAIKNHSSDFWNYLDSLSANSKGLDKQMKSYRMLVV